MIQNTYESYGMGDISNFSRNKQTIFEGRKQIVLLLHGPLLEILKNTLELKQLTNKNHEFI
jgi:hypothetical protein